MAYAVIPDTEGKRIDIQASELSGMTRSRIQTLIESGLLTVNGSVPKPNYKTRTGDEILITLPEETGELIPENIPLDVLFMDDALIVVNKPPGMVVYPSVGHEGGTLMNAIAFHAGRLASVGGPLRPGIVHRIDKDTSGVMIVALDDTAYYNLVAQFKDRSIFRKYLTLIYGDMKTNSGEISLKIGRSETDRKKMSTRVRDGKEALTRWVVVERYPGATLIEAKLGTGRTHQIRVHFSSVGHPVLGDTTYGKKTALMVRGRKVLFPRQMLHAEVLGFTHPITGAYMEFRREMPEDMREAIRQLRTKED
ncbi:MAG: RluA family pseudouridine synthase [Nitrospiraceae bacterium]|nr:RluA family pseudouridine synthase [Nitrospiraceae bacterium]